MLSKIRSAICIGIDAYPIEIEVDITESLPQITIVGLPDQAVKESKDRIKAAIKNSGIKFPSRRKIIINLAPADIKKEGPIFDLPIAIGILSAAQMIKPGVTQKYAMIGELALDGSLRPVKGALSIALSLTGTHKSLILPAENAGEAALQETVDIIPVSSIADCISFLNEDVTIDPASATTFTLDDKHSIDFCDVHGQETALRAIEVATSGGHNIIMMGPPGSGKTMLAQRIPTILPKLSKDEALEIIKIHSSNTLMQNLKIERPFRMPHHTSSQIAIIGGGSIPKPGEVSLAHNGVLFLDELAEFSRSTLEVLRLPLEDRKVTIARAKDVLTFPAMFMLVCATNPCPCGYYNDKERDCNCSGRQIQRYFSKISGPLMDRIDIHFEVKRVSLNQLNENKMGEGSEFIRERVRVARKIQTLRYGKTKTRLNAKMSVRNIKRYCQLTTEANDLLMMAAKELSLSARAYHKVLKVARTITDLKLARRIITEKIPAKHVTKEMIDQNIDTTAIAEAVQYRALDKGMV